MTSNAIRQKTEDAVVLYLAPYLKRTVVCDSVLTSDQSAAIFDKPYVLVIAREHEEVYGPNSGLFKVTVNILFASHVAETSPQQREDVVTSINNFVYSSPASTISGASGFYCHGIVPKNGEMTVNPDEKTYDYNLTLEVWCMPRDNT